jgi:hypothetical protein
MANEIEQAVRGQLEKQATKGPNWTLPRLRELQKIIGHQRRDQKGIAKALQYQTTGGDVSHFCLSCVAEGFIDTAAEREGQTYGIAEIGRLFVQGTKAALERAIPLYIAQHERINAVTYEYHWEDFAESELRAVYDTHAVTQAENRAQAFCAIRPFYRAAKDGNVDQLVQLVGECLHGKLTRLRRTPVARIKMSPAPEPVEAPIPESSAVRPTPPPEPAPAIRSAETTRKIVLTELVNLAERRALEDFARLRDVIQSS